MIYGASGDGLAGDEVALDWFDGDNNRGHLTEGHFIVIRDLEDLKNGVAGERTQQKCCCYEL